MLEVYKVSASSWVPQRCNVRAHRPLALSYRQSAALVFCVSVEPTMLPVALSAIAVGFESSMCACSVAASVLA
jgi:hypothetical protein